MSIFIRLYSNDNERPNQNPGQFLPLNDKEENRGKDKNVPFMWRDKK